MGDMDQEEFRYHDVEELRARPGKKVYPSGRLRELLEAEISKYPEEWVLVFSLEEGSIRYVKHMTE